jgi:hypothetical protein
MEGLSLVLKKGKDEGKLSGVKVSRIIKILRLFFVDDVLVMTKASIDEGLEIKICLLIFRSASGLLINWTKSIFYHVRFHGETLENLKDIFPYNFEELAKGFRYLGYFLKVDAYKTVDWRWLLSKIEDRIGMWCNRWLSLGGRFTLVKYVLESQLVYWMALAAIPASILEKIRKLIFSFLWSGDEGKTHFHLCSWEVIAKPKLMGGWGIRNIYLFNNALAENSLWRVLVKEGVWNKVIKDKYIPHRSVVTWLRSAPTTASSASQT